MTPENTPLDYVPKPTPNVEVTPAYLARELQAIRLTLDSLARAVRELQTYVP